MTLYVIEIVQGETLFEEIVIKDEGGDPVDLAAAAKSVKVSPPLLAGNFTVTDGPETGSLKLRADGDFTINFPVGKHFVQIWLDWGNLADVEDEIAFEAVVSVRKAL